MNTEEKMNVQNNNNKLTTEIDNNIRNKLRKNPNKTKLLYTDYLFGSKGKISTKDKEICLSIIEKIKKDEKSYLFRQPAVRSFLEQKDKEYYRAHIKEPRDLGYITKKLNNANDYTVKEFHRDLELCWSNAISINERDTEAYKYAVYFKDFCNKLYKEKGLFQIIEKENEREKEIQKETISNISSFNSIDETYFTPNKIPSKRSKNQSKRSKKDKIENDILNTAYINNYKIIKNNDINYLVGTCEIKDNEIINKLIGKKRNRELEEIMGEWNEKLDERNEKQRVKKAIQSIKSIKKKIKKIKKTKNKGKDTINENALRNSKKSTIPKELSFKDIKKKYPINHKVISGPDDLKKIIPEKKNIKSFGKANKTSNHSEQSDFQNKITKNNENIININGCEYHIETYEERLESFYQFMINYLKENKKKIFDEYEKSMSYYSRIISKTSSKRNSQVERMTFRENSCDRIDSHRDILTTSSKRLSKQESNSKSNKIHYSQSINNNKEGKFQNNDNSNIIHPNNVAAKGDNDKNLQLKYYIAKCFDKLDDDKMIEVLVFIENIRPQSIKLLSNDSVYINFETFTDETFTKVCEFVKKYFN